MECQTRERILDRIAIVKSDLNKIDTVRKSPADGKVF